MVAESAEQAHMSFLSQSYTRDFYKYYSIVDEIIFASCKCAKVIKGSMPNNAKSQVSSYARILCFSRDTLVKVQ